MLTNGIGEPAVVSEERILGHLFEPMVIEPPRKSFILEKRVFSMYFFCSYRSQVHLTVDSIDQQSIQFVVTDARATIMTAIRPTWIVTPAQEVE
jgi:hypothetical protein